MSNAIANQLFLAYLGRPADKGWRDATGTLLNNGPPSVALQTAFYNAAVLDGVFSTSDSPATLVNKIFQQIFGFQAQAFEQVAWGNLITTGVISAQTAAWTIFSSYMGATNVPPEYKIPAQNKLVAADAYVTQLGLDGAANAAISQLGSAAATSARTFLSGITTQAQAATAVTGIAATVSSVGTSATGQTFTLTTNADSFTGSSGNDIFNAVAGTGATLSAADILNGGQGTDTLSVVTDGNFTLIGSNLTSIEKYSVNATTAAAVTFSNVSGYSELINNNSSAALTYGVGTAGGVQGNLTLTINGATANTVLVYSDTALTGTSDSLTVAMTGYGSSSAVRNLTVGPNTAAANALETLNIVATGTNAVKLTTDGTQTSLKTINISGAGSLILRNSNAANDAADSTATSATTINAASATGNLTIGQDATGNTLGAANHTVTLGSGNDSVFFGANLNGSDTVDGGAGTDTLGVSAAVTNAIMANVKNFEVLRVSMGGNVTQDAGISSLTGFNYSVTGGHTLTLNNLANNTAVTVAGNTTTLTAVLKDGSGLADALTVNLGGSVTLGTLTAVTGLETLNISSTTSAATTNAITNANVTAKYVITGNADLSMTTASTQVDSTAFTGKLTVTGGNTATNFQLGTGADAVTLGTGADTVNAGAGNDRIVLGTAGANNVSGADVIVTGAGNDTIRFVGNTAAGTGGSTDYAAFATVTDFTVGTTTSASDFLAFSASNADFSLKSQGGTDRVGLAKGDTAQALAADDAMVVQTIAKDASAAALTANVALFKLTTATAFTTDVKGTFAAAIGTGSITGLAANGNYLVSVFDSTNNKALIGVVNVGGNTDDNTALASNDFTNASVALVGVVNMTAADYANFGATNLAVAF